MDSRHINVVSLSSPRTGPLYPPGDILGTHFCQRLSQSHVRIATGRMKSMKDPNDPIRNRTRDLPPFGAVPRPTAPPRAQFPLTHLVVVDFIFCTQGTLYSNETLTPQQSVNINERNLTCIWLIIIKNYSRQTPKRSVCLLLCVIRELQKLFETKYSKWIRRCHCI
jgi:hypothetical protein